MPKSSLALQNPVALQKKRKLWRVQLNLIFIFFCLEISFQSLPDEPGYMKCTRVHSTPTQALATVPNEASLKTKILELLYCNSYTFWYLKCKHALPWNPTTTLKVMTTLKEYSSLTRKGKFTACNILFSFSVCSICFSLTT